MNKLFSWLAPYRSHLFAMIGVIAVCGVGAALFAYFHIQAQQQTITVQNDRIGDLVEANSSWAKWARHQQRLRHLEQVNTRLLQDQLALIEAQSTDASERLKQLEAANVEVKELLGRRLPADLRGLLEQR